MSICLTLEEPTYPESELWVSQSLDVVSCKENSELLLCAK
jgi:hypothetical protein